MTDPAPAIDPPLERYRSYLALIARAELHPLVRGKVGASDVVQETLLEAHAARDQFRGENDRQRAAWLRRILARNLAQAVRDLRRQKRDVARERPLERAIDESCIRLESWLSADATSPSGTLEREERLAALAQGLASVKDETKLAIYYRYWQGLSLKAIAERMDRSSASVAGLLHRGLRELRGLLREVDPQ